LCSIYGKARYEEGICLGRAGSGFEGGGVSGDDPNDDSGSLFEKEFDVTTEGSRIFGVGAVIALSVGSTVDIDACTIGGDGTGHPSEFCLAARAAKDVVAWPSSLGTPMTVDDLALLTQVSTPLVFRAVSYGEYCGSGDSAGVALRTSGFVFGTGGCFGSRRGVCGVVPVDFDVLDIWVVAEGKVECLD